MSTTRKPTISPKKANRGQMWRMRRAHTEVGDFSLMTNGEAVWLSEQKIGEERTQHIKLPKGIFNRLLVWYEKPGRTK